MLCNALDLLSSTVEKYLKQKEKALAGKESEWKGQILRGRLAKV
jgi:hypothetical protein